MFGNSYVSKEVKIRDVVIKSWCVIGSLARIMRGVNVYMEVKNGLRNSILLTLTYGSEDWMWNRKPLLIVEISYRR